MNPNPRRGLALALLVAVALLTACTRPAATPSPTPTVLRPPRPGQAPRPTRPAPRPSPRPPTRTATPTAECPRGYLTFVVNVHDWVHHDQSAATLLRLVDLFERYGVRGDFYLTAPVTRAYATEHPEVIQRLRDSGMTLSYHVRAPHPLVAGFGARLAGLSPDALRVTLLDYETYALDLTTGDLDRTRPGGYAYVAQVFGRPPVVASAGAGEPQVARTARQVYASLGARMTVLYHEAGSPLADPWQQVDGLWVRPVDFSVTRVDLGEGRQNFWWNLLRGPHAATAAPVSLLQAGLARWEAQAPPRPPFVLAHIHENNFYRSGSVAWGSFYYAIDAHGNKTTPLTPPFDLDAADPSTPRPAAEQEAIWAAYEDLVAWAAAHLCVVTSEDLVPLAEAAAGP